MEVVTERLLHEERKLKDHADSTGVSSEKAMTAKQQSRKKGPKCHHCGKIGHIKRECRDVTGKKADKSQKESRYSKQKANKAEVKKRDDDSSSSDTVGLIVTHAGLVGAAAHQNNWIVDSGATCHMCNNSKCFVDLRDLEQPQEISLGDGHTVKANKCGAVMLQMKLPGNEIKKCKLHDVLYVPALTYNLLSISRATKSGKTTEFTNNCCRITDTEDRLIAVATRIGSLYYLDCESVDQSNTAENNNFATEDLWHRRYGHLGAHSLKKLAHDKLVEGFNYDASRKLSFCEPCVSGKHHRSQFPTNCSERSSQPLGLVHSDVCGKMCTQSLSGAEYFLTFIDDNTRYVWVYVLKHKHEVFERFLEWKAMVEKSTGQKLKALRTDNGGEYTSERFQNYLKTEGVRHELTVPKTPEQNGVAERMNRTLVEAVRAMLADAGLPKKFWAEALSTAVYLRNRSPTTVLEVTPFESWTGKKPQVEHLRIFGCMAYAHVAKDERQKLDPKAQKCILLGYGTETKGYRLYSPVHRKVFYSRDVLFNEDVCSLEDKSDECQQKEPVLISGQESHDDDDVSENEADSVLQRPVRQRKPPNRYGEWTTIADAEPKEPTTLAEAVAGQDKEKWLNAMNDEMESLYANDVWDPVELPKGRKAIGSKWVFKLKVNAEGVVDRYKARLVAQGFSQKFGEDYDETFCPVVRHESIRTLIALAVQDGLKLHQMDITTAFLNGELKEEVYMKQPEGFIVKGQEDLVCRLKRSIYGLKQSGRCWNNTLDEELKKMGFVQSAGDPCIYIASEGEVCIVAVYVDDIIIGAKTDDRILQIKRDLRKRFKAKDMGELHHFLGMKIIQNQNSGEVWISQPAYTQDILEKFHMVDAKPVSTPFDASSKLMNAVDDSDVVDTELYQSAVGSLLYLSVATRPDIAFAVSNVAKYCARPTKQHWIAVKRIMRYLKGTLNHGLCYTLSHNTQCVGFSDADFAGDIDDRKSTSGYMFQMSGAAISWRSKKQACVALSTAEAEYIALASAGQEAVWIRQLLSDMRSTPIGPTMIFEDNQSTISMVKNPHYHGRAKHVDIKFHFIQELAKTETVQLEYCCSDDMLADMLTKGLPREHFVKLRELSGVRELN